MKTLMTHNITIKNNLKRKSKSCNKNGNNINVKYNTTKTLLLRIHLK